MTMKTSSGLANQLLDDIIQIQQEFILTDDPQPAFRLFLRSVLNLTDSEYGYVGEIIGPIKEKPRLKTHAILDLSKNQPNGLAQSGDLSESFGHLLESGKAVIPDMRNKQMEMVWLPESHPKIDTVMWMPLHAGNSFVGVVGLANRKDGYAETDLKSVKPLLDIAAHMLVVTRERNQRRQLEQEHAHAQKISRAVLETALDCIIGMDEQGCIAEFNPAAEITFGWSKSEIVGKKLADIVIPEKLRAAHENGLTHFLKTGEGPVLGKRIEVTAIKKNNEEFPVELAIAAHKMQGEYFFTAHIRDISDRRKTEEVLSKSKELAESASRAKSSFVATISHEIRTPINAIMGALGLLATAEVDAASRRLLEIAQTSARALLGLVDSVLDFSRIETGEVVLESEQLRTGVFFDEILDLLSGAAADGGVQLGCVCHLGVPGQLSFDVGKVRQILLNLVGNAIKFSPAGEVRIDLELEGSGLRFSVSDNGVGISTEDCARIFDEFAQFGGARDLGGTGLGLAICKRLVELIGGEIGVESSVGLGSTFWFTLPYDLSHSTSGVRKGKTFKKVIVIGDGGFYEELLKEQLNAWDIGHSTARNFFDAQEILRHSDDIDAVYLLSSNTTLDSWVAGAVGLSSQCRESDLPLLLIAEVDGECARCLRRKLELTSIISTPVSPVALRKSLERTGDDRIDEGKPTLSSSVSESQHRSIRVLLAEDSLSNRLVMAEVLRRCGFEVDVAGNGAEALAAVSSLPYHVVLMDIDMPEMNGIDATHAIRGLESAASDVPIIAITAHATANDKDRFLSEGMNDYICKPVDRETLGSKVRQWASGALELDVSTGETLHLSVRERSNTLLVDENALRQLADDTSPELVPKMVAVFIRELRLRAVTISDAVDKVDTNTLKTEAHALKSSAATYGAAAVRIQALQIEEGSDDNDDERTIAAARDLLELVEPTAQSLENRFHLG